MSQPAPGEIESEVLKVRESGAGSLVAVKEVFIPFSKVHRVVSAAVGSRFWQLQEGDFSDEEDLILAEAADEEEKTYNRTSEISSRRQGIGARSFTSPGVCSSLQVGGMGALTMDRLRRLSMI